MPDTAPAVAPPVVEAPPAAPDLPTDADLVAAIEGKAPPKVEEPKAPEPKKPEEPPKPKETAVLRSIQKREAALQTERAAFQAQVQAAQANQQQAIDAGIAKALKERFADPRVAVKTLKDLGLLPQQIAEALVKPDAPSADELARQALSEAQAIKKGLETEAQQRASKANEDTFVSTAKAMADKLPHLFDEWTAPEILAEAYKFGAELQAECKRMGKPVPDVSDDRVLRALDKRAKARQDLRAERAKAKAAAQEDVTKAAAGAAPQAATNGSGQQGKPTGAPATTTLGKGLSERQSVAVDDPVLMSDEDIVKRAEEQIAKGLNIKAR